MKVVAKSEIQLQAEIFSHHWNNHPSERGLLFHVNNKARNAIEGNRMKAMGVIAGVSDFIYLRPFGKPLFMELKTETGVQSPEQKKWQLRIEAAGYEYCIVKSLEDAFCFFPKNPLT
jgi:hypothetical protein